MDIKDLNRLLHKDYVTKVVCKESYFQPTFTEATLISITYTPNLVTLELDIINPAELNNSVNIWLDQFTAITLSTDETTVYLRVEDLSRKCVVLMLEFYLIPHIDKVDLSIIYAEQ
jgi:hypothetical protein